MRALTATIAMLAMSACIDADGPYTEPAIGEIGYSTYTETRYPIVLVHGLLGFDDLFGVVRYFDGIPEALEASGARVFVVTASQAERPEVRGQQLIPQLEAILAETGATRLNLFGHSLGALDARYVAAVRPDLVASVTSIGGPHRGTPVAAALDNPLGGAGLTAIADLIKLVSGSTDPNDGAAALAAMTPAGATAFNAAYPAGVPSGCGQGEPVVGGIRYYSWGGVGGWTNPLDLGDPLLVAASLLVGEPNDGLVGRCSTHLGMVIRDDYAQNHLDETNMLLGMVGLLGPRPAALYRQQANRLKLAGL